ncbi:DUF1654 domain-containing protein [Halomonas sp. M20]|uniref:DUF1654 domain-containing protein n=1 Tax=Halomonas sp. M20 TaxID=2763264 RepID=UPI001D0B6A5B|nr:DUF1654 domain-containing protein [Halomonas sp. M20]
MATPTLAHHDYHLVIQRLPDESKREWQRTLDKIEAHGHATVTRLPDDCAGLRWELQEAVA